MFTGRLCRSIPRSSFDVVLRLTIDSRSEKSFQTRFGGHLNTRILLTLSLTSCLPLLAEAFALSRTITRDSSSLNEDFQSDCYFRVIASTFSSTHPTGDRFPQIPSFLILPEIVSISWACVLYWIAICFGDSKLMVG